MMKVLLVNGSPHKNGCTNRALEEVAKVLSYEGCVKVSGDRSRVYRTI